MVIVRRPVCSAGQGERAVGAAASYQGVATVLPRRGSTYGAVVDGGREADGRLGVVPSSVLGVRGIPNRPSA